MSQPGLHTAYISFILTRVKWAGDAVIAARPLPILALP